MKRIHDGENLTNGTQKKKGNSNYINKSLNKNIEKIKKQFGQSTDIMCRTVKIKKDSSLFVGILYIDGLSDKDYISNYIMKSLMREIKSTRWAELLSTEDSILKIIETFILTVGHVRKIYTYDELYTALLSGDTLILVDGYTQGLQVNTSGAEHRGVQEPNSQMVIRGPKDGFSENLRINTALIRRKIKNPNLWVETKIIGNKTKTSVSIMYIKNSAKENVIQDVKKKLEQIEIDGIFESGNIEELIQDKTSTPFPTIYNTERPDVIAAGLLEGKIAILVDGTPFVLLVPAVFIQFIHSPEDYYQRSDYGILRLLRLFSLILALLAPSLYIAMTTFHQEMIPTSLLINIAAQREGVPFPAFVEALIMECTFEILREAGIRMPKAVGQAVSIVGALVMGQAAVEAGIVSSIMVIIVAITAISSFVIPSYNMGIAIRILRFGFIILAAFLGLFGIFVGFITLLLHLCSLSSFGVPYMSPLAPLNFEKQRDAIFRFPIQRNKKH